MISKLKLYRFMWDFGRMGQIEGLFVAEEYKVVDLIGKEIDFGEVLGKHSEVCAVMEKDDIEEISDDQDKIKWLVDVVGGNTISGYNPLDADDY